MLHLAVYTLMNYLPSSSLGSSWVTLTCRRSTRSPSVFTLIANSPAWTNSSPNTSSANLPTDTQLHILTYSRQSFCITAFTSTGVTVSLDYPICLSHLHMTYTFATFYEPFTPYFKNRLTEAAELADDVCQADIGDTFQLTTDGGRNGLATHMPWLYVPCYQRHDGVWWVVGPNPDGEKKEGHFRQKYSNIKRRLHSTEKLTSRILLCITCIGDTSKFRPGGLIGLKW